MKERKFLSMTDDRIAGTLYGVAIGDCLGAPAEFKTKEEIRKQYGQITEIMEGSLIGAKAGCGTDDTAMTLALAEGIIRAKQRKEDIVEAVGAQFVKWYNGTPIGMGATCARAIRHASRNGFIASPTRDQWCKASYDTHVELGGKSGGNGTLMRTAPVALLYTNADKCAEIAMDLSEMTHWDNDAASACADYCGMIQLMILGYDWQIVTESIYNADDRWAILKYPDALKLDFKPRPTGYVVDSFKAALWAIERTDSFYTALVSAVNLGGDADTIGAIAGGLAGARYGYSAIPEKWIKALHPDLVARMDIIIDEAIKCWG